MYVTDGTGEMVKPPLSVAAARKSDRTSERMRLWMHQAEERWFPTRLRAKLADGVRSAWMERYVARSISLRALWWRLRGSA
jgi:hypothetical protein